MTEDRIILPITPFTNVRTTQNSKILFRIPLICSKGRSKKGCVKYHRTGLCKHTLSESGRRTRARLEKYRAYKTELKNLCDERSFTLPGYGFAFYFYFPMPLKWSNKKKKLFHGQPHFAEPDIDNLEKAFYDALSLTDERVGQVSGHGKFWVDASETLPDGTKIRGNGYIEILLNQPVYNPFNVTFINQDEYRNRPKRKRVPRKEGYTKRRKPVRKLKPIQLRNDVLK